MKPSATAIAFKVWWVKEGRSPATADLYCKVLRDSATGTLKPSYERWLPQAKSAFRRFRSVTSTIDNGGWDHVERPPRWATHAAYMLGEAIQRYLISMHGQTAAEKKSAAREFGTSKWQWPSSVSQLFWGQVAWGNIVSISSPGGGPPLRDDGSRFWGAWLWRLKIYSGFAEDDLRTSTQLPVFPSKPRSLIAIPRREMAMLFLEEQEDGEKPFRIYEPLPAKLRDEIEPKERFYIRKCAEQMRDESHDPGRDVKYDLEKNFSYFKD